MSIVQYFGGKARICKQIADIINTNINKDDIFISPFCGGLWVEQLIECDKKYLSDKHYYLIELYKAIQRGWMPPKNLSKEEYQYIMHHKDEKPYLTGFVGFGCSFSGKWFGGYAKNGTDRNYCSNAHNSIMKKMDKLMNCKFECKDYREITPHNAIIYCDPPYCGTTQYNESIVGKFNTDEFWNTMRKWSKDNKVYISEYNAPDDFKCIWQQEVKLDIRNKDNQKEKRTEKLYTY